jgi:hypothetical protein
MLEFFLKTKNFSNVLSKKSFFKRKYLLKITASVPALLYFSVTKYPKKALQLPEREKLFDVAPESSDLPGHERGRLSQLLLMGSLGPLDGLKNGH